jgi:hypothetical protein
MYRCSSCPYSLDTSKSSKAPTVHTRPGAAQAPVVWTRPGAAQAPVVLTSPGALTLVVYTRLGAAKASIVYSRSGAAQVPKYGEEKSYQYRVMLSRHDQALRPMWWKHVQVLHRTL